MKFFSFISQKTKNYLNFFETNNDLNLNKKYEE